MVIGRRPLLVFAVATLAGPANAADPAARDEVVEVAQASLADAPYDPDADIDSRMQRFMSESGLAAEREKGRLFLSAGKASVKVTPADPDWVKYRAAAYAEAVLNAQATLVSEQNTTIKTQTVLKFMKGVDDPPQYVPDGSRGQASEVIAKILAVAGGRLDKELQELGVDPKTYASAPLTQKTVMLNDALRQTTTERSLGDTIGTCPVKTFESRDAAGQYVIGAVIVTSSVMRDFTRQMATARGNFDPAPDRAQDLSKLFADEKSLFEDFGVRRLFDQQGLPVVVSFGQWSSSYRGTDSTLAASYRDAARHQAELIADGQIADFVKGSLTYDRSGTTGREMSVVAAAIPENTTVETTKRAFDEMQKSMIRSSSLQVTGLATLRTWTGTHPASKTPIVGVIRIWSAAGEKAMRSMLTPTRPAAKTGPAPRGTAGASESRQLMDQRDF